MDRHRLYATTVSESLHSGSSSVLTFFLVRHVFTLDPERFPLAEVRELVSTLHARQQSYIVMVDPAVAYYNYSAFNNGVEAGAFLKISNGSVYQGVVWPGKQNIHSHCIVQYLTHNRRHCIP